MAGWGRDQARKVVQRALSPPRIRLRARWSTALAAGAATGICCSSPRRNVDVHPIPAEQLSRRCACGAEEHGGGRHHGRVSCGTTTPQLLLLNKNGKLQSLITDFFHPQQKLMSQAHSNAKIAGTYDRTATPPRRHLPLRRCWRTRPPFLPSTSTGSPPRSGGSASPRTVPLVTLATSTGGISRRSHPTLGLG
jgi:hypothetical protein